MKTHITIGAAQGGGNLQLDIGVLLKTRLLIQANSGGGKSFLIRRIAEQLFGTVPVIIIDPEGEFATLREKFGFVLVGKGGETPADPRSAALVATKLLELRASAVCDLYEMKPHERHHWVKLFLEALIDAPKNLWNPTVIIGDEWHTFCPEKGAGESEASDAAIGIITRGRKRRFCFVAATQRLGKLRKDASAELLNRLIGPTFEDVDLKRAADLLSVTDRREFDHQMRVLEPGNFFALGRALCNQRTLVRVGPVETTHEIDDARIIAGPPPTPDKIKGLLPKLAELPKQAEEKAKTEADLRTEIRSLKAQLAARPKAEPAPQEKISVLTDDDRRLLNRVIDTQGKAVLDSFEKQQAKTMECIRDMRTFFDGIASKISTALPKRTAMVRPTVRPSAAPVIRRPVPPQVSNDGEFKINSAQQRILDALAWYESLGNIRPTLPQVGAVALIDTTGGYFSNSCGPLSVNGLVNRENGTLSLTEEGRKFASTPDSVGSLDDYHEVLRRRVLKMRSASNKTVDILNVIINRGGAELTSEEIGAEANIDHTGGYFSNSIGPLSTLGLIKRQRGMIVPTEILFPEALR